MLDQPWTNTALVALDLEGTGAQDREHEAILEIATVPLAGGSPDISRSYETLINPGRTVPRRPWISPGLSDEVLGEAPAPESIGPELATRINGCYLAGHNVGVDWRLLHRRYPNIHVRGLVDTLKLAKHRKATTRSLTTLIEHYALTGHVAELVPDGRPHRAMWDAVATALLLPALIDEHWNQPPSLADLLALAGQRIDEQSPTAGSTFEQQTLS